MEAPLKWVWVKTKPPGFSPWFHLPGQPILSTCFRPTAKKRFLGSEPSFASVGPSWASSPWASSSSSACPTPSAQVRDTRDSQCQLFSDPGQKREPFLGKTTVGGAAPQKRLRFEQSPPSTLTSLRHVENSNIGSVNKSQAPSNKKPGEGLNEVACSQPKATQKHHFPSLRVHSKHEGSNMTRKPNFALSELLWRWRDTGGIHWRILASRSGSVLAGYWQDPPARDTQRDTRRDPLAGSSGGILGGIHWRAPLAGYWAGSTGGLLWWDARRDPLASRSGEQLWRDTAVAGYSAGSTCEPLWRDTRRDPLASSSGGILGGIHW